MSTLSDNLLILQDLLEENKGKKKKKWGDFN